MNRPKYSIELPNMPGIDHKSFQIMQMCDVKCNHLDVIKQLVISTLVQLDFHLGKPRDFHQM